MVVRISTGPKLPWCLRGASACGSPQRKRASPTVDRVKEGVPLPVAEQPTETRSCCSRLGQCLSSSVRGPASLWCECLPHSWYGFVDDPQQLPVVGVYLLQASWPCYLLPAWEGFSRACENHNVQSVRTTCHRRWCHAVNSRGWESMAP